MAKKKKKKGMYTPKTMKKGRGKPPTTKELKTIGTGDSMQREPFVDW